MKKQLGDLGISPSRRKGQNFLASSDVASHIIDSAEISSEEKILEIGPGLGILTFQLADRAKEVIAIELEPVFADHLRREAEKRDITNITVIQGDALSIDLPVFDKVVANLPYSISSPLTFRLLSMNFGSAILMFQKEFGLRLIAGPGTKQRGVPTLKANYYAEMEGLFEVPAEAFYPVPQVDSLVLRMTPRPFPHDVQDRDFYMKLIDIIFQHRRRKLRNTLLIGFMNLPGVSGMGKDEFRTLVESSVPGKLLDLRPEQLEVEEMVLLSNSLWDGLTTHR